MEKPLFLRIKCTVTNATSLMNSDLSYVSIYPFFEQLGPDYHPLDLRPLTTQGKLNKPETRDGEALGTRFNVVEISHGVMANKSYTAKLTSKYRRQTDLNAGAGELDRNKQQG